MDDPSLAIAPGELRQLAAERAIQRVINDYGRGIDERDFEQVRRCFHPEATIAYGSRPRMRLDDAIAWLERALRAVFGMSHYFGPAIVNLAEDGLTASCSTWCINTNQYPRGPAGEEKQTVAGLRYADAFSKRDGVWRIDERRNWTEWIVAVDGNERLPVPGAGDV